MSDDNSPSTEPPGGDIAPSGPPSGSSASPNATAPGGERAKPIQYNYSPSFAELLEGIGGTLLISTYQAGKLMVVRAEGGKLNTLLRHFEKPMGMAVSPQRMALGGRRDIWSFRNALDIAPQIQPEQHHDACLVPRSSHVTGDIKTHELGFVGDELWFVNTRFSCLCTLDDSYSFVPRWRPPFVTELAADDRCHLNGLAIDGDQVRFVTAHGDANTEQGWRENRAHGGVMVDVASGQIISRELSMPHSPRVHGGHTWVLNSGYGQLEMVSMESGKRDVVARLPGFTRGLAFWDRFAFVGLSKIREKREFGGLPLEEWLDDKRCGVFAIDVSSGQLVGFMEFTQGCSEIFDVQFLPGFKRPTVLGLSKPTVDGVFIVPPDAMSDAAPELLVQSESDEDDKGDESADV